MSHKSHIFSQYDRPLTFGHRGVPEEHQENTLAGFKRAVELEIDGVELDVFLTKDKKLVVFHDMDTQRLTGFKGQVPEMTWDQLRELDIDQCIDVGDKVINYGKKEKMVLLEDALEEMRGKLIVDIEIKAYGLDYGQCSTGTEVARLVRKMDLFNEVFVTSFNFFPLYALERECPGIESGFAYAPESTKGGLRHNLMESSLVGRLVGSTQTNMCVNMFDNDSIERIHKKGFAVGAWTLFSQDSKWLGVWLSEEQQINYIKNFAARKIDYIITDDPVKMQSILQSL